MKVPADVVGLVGRRCGCPPVPVVNDPYPLAEACRAHEDLWARRTVGKVVLRP
jgi:hypothetical protein